MAAAPRYLFDTNIVLLSTRKGSPASAKIDEQFAAQAFRPTICEVSLGELWAFAKSSSWGEPRQELLRRTIDHLVVLPISDERTTGTGLRSTPTRRAEGCRSFTITTTSGSRPRPRSPDSRS
jgi:predicted nucleic acid-binding protein